MKPDRRLTERAAVALTPEYVSLLRDLQKRDGRISFPAELAALQSHYASYVMLYEDERRIGFSLLLAMLGEEECKTWIEKLNSASPAQQQAWLDDMASLDERKADSLFDEFHLPETSAEWAAAREEFSALPDEEKTDALKQAGFFWSFFFSSFYNFLSLMVHGVKLTTLVQQAISGDDAAYLKAVQVDRFLLLHHPYFRDRKRIAQENRETGFLRKLLNRELCSPVHSRIRYPGLYMLFGVLEAFQWLDELRHEEILDMVDAAGLDLTLPQ